MRISDWSSDVCSSDLTVIGTNKIYLGFERFDFYPRYYVAVNPKVLGQSADRIRELNCVKFLSDRRSDFIPEDGLTYHINTTRAPARFCRDISDGVHEGWTVTHAALQVARYLGFSEVVLVEIGRASCRERVCQSV